MINIRSYMHVLCCLLICCSAVRSFAQKAYEDSLFRLYADEGTNNRLPPSYFIVQFNQAIPPGIVITRQLNAHTAIISQKGLVDIPEASLLYRSPANNNWKLTQPYLAGKEKSGQQPVILSGDLSLIMALLKKDFPRIAILRTDSISRSVVVRASPKNMQVFMHYPCITFIDIQRKPSAEIGIIGYDRSFHGINDVAASMPGANGHNIVVGVKEQKMEQEDLDLYKRVLSSSIAPENITNHATVISSIIGGAGNSFYDGLGIANGCLFFPSTFSNLFADDMNVLNAAKVTVQNHSYGTVIQQFYGAEALSYDAQTWANKNIVHIFSAGNQGTANAADGKYKDIPGYANLTGNFKMAKNIITVGAIDNKGVIAAESSAGPLYDGRLAPQLIALGPNGTSDAAAMVSGTVAVLQQLYADSNHQQLPASSLIKAILYTSADDSYHSSIDYKTGYGLLNSYKSIKLLQQRSYFNFSIASGNEWNTVIDIPVKTSQLKLTLAWNDMPATLNNSTALINDLDLELTDLNTGAVYAPWILSSYPHSDSLNSAPVRGRDSLNTAEQITIRMPAPGKYRIKVKPVKVADTPIDFSVAYQVDTLNTFRFTSPRHAADVNREENPEAAIRWTAEIADSTETGDLFVSYDQGSNWQLIAASVELGNGLYHWTIPAVSSGAILKMNTSFGDFLSPAFIISRLTRPQPDFVCTDSFRLSWNRHVYARSYQVYTLADSAYMKPVINTVDTFVVLDRRKYPSLVYAILPVLSDHLPAARSVAFDITLQGVQCFFRALNYVLEDDNRINMKLELSAPGYADSVFFEQVTGSGLPVKLFGSAKAVAEQAIYSQISGQPVAGTIYIRAAIKLKTGAIIYTDLIPVFTSGQKNVLFYPNPINRSETLRYVMKQGISPDCRLQIFGSYGKLAKDYYSLPPSIVISDLMRGIYFLKLTDRSGKTVATEKLVIP